MRTHVEAAPAVPGFVDAVVHPLVNAIVCAASSAQARLSAPARARRRRVVAAALEAGPAALSDRQRLFFLSDPVALAQLHVQVWTAPTAHPTWLATWASDSRDDGSELRAAS